MPRRLKTRATAPDAPIRRGKLDLRKQVCTESDATLAARALMRKGAQARQSIEDFYRLVIRHEITKEPLEPAPHQKVMFSFVEHHPKSVHRIPIGCGKTFGMAAVSLWLTGNDVTQRGAILSKTQQQAAKPVSMVADYITEPILNRPLILAFPWLRKSPRSNDPWTMNKLTVERPPGIRDPTLIAVGLDGAIGGARLSWLVADDTIDIDNSSTPDSREKARVNLEGRILSRLDPKGSRAVFTNTPWDREDLTYHLQENAHWPTLQMDIYGNIKVWNADAAWLHMAEQKYLRPARDQPVKGETVYRLREHDPDPDEKVPLWPDRMTLDEIEQERRTKMPHEFARLYLCEPFDAAAARCQREWVEKCKKRGIGLPLVHSYKGNNPVFTGLDLGIGNLGQHDLTVFFTFELEEDGSRRLLNIESGRFSGPRIVEMIGDMHRRYGSVVIVESNAAQDYIRQFAQRDHKDLIIKAHTTTRANKLSEDFGVESIFTELQNAAWIIPCDRSGKCEPEVQRWIDDMLYYMPHKHTGDHLMACWIARERARRHGHNDPKPTPGKRSRWAAEGDTNRGSATWGHRTTYGGF